MITSKTGAGSLSRKLTAILVLSAMSTLGYTADNSIYINQSGSTSEINMIQDGAGNVVRGVQGVGGGNTTPATINGDSNTVTVNQVGTGNTLNFGIQTTIDANPLTNGNTFNYSVTGNNATATIDSNANGAGSSASNYLNVIQTGNYAGLTANILGSNNSIVASTAGGSNNTILTTTNGNSNSQTIAVTGGGSNNVTINQGIGGSAVTGGSLATSNNNGTVNLSITGASNAVTIAQTSAGYADTTVLALNGSSNVANIVQNASAGNTTVNIQSVGSGNHFSINSNAH
jgi:hypothetical protein